MAVLYIYVHCTYMYTDFGFFALTGLVGKCFKVFRPKFFLLQTFTNTSQNLQRQKLFQNLAKLEII